jgi:Na+-transporting NADH:ubiquinone oxidoreductase subunit NqrB
VTNWTPTRLLILADAIGFAALAVQLIFIFRWLVPEDEFRLLEGVLAYGALTVCALWMWHGEKMAQKISGPAKWAAVIGGSIFAGALSFVCDMIVGSINNPGLSAVKAGTRAGSPFGFILTVLICPGLTMVAVAGFIRSFLWRSEKGDA